MPIVEATPVEHRRAVLRARAGSKTRRGSFKGCHPGARDEAGHIVQQAAKKPVKADKPVSPSPLEKAYKQKGWRTMPKGMAQKQKSDESSSEEDTAIVFKRKASSGLSLSCGIKIATPSHQAPMYKRMKMGNRQK